MATLNCAFQNLNFGEETYNFLIFICQRVIGDILDRRWFFRPVKWESDGAISMGKKFGVFMVNPNFEESFGEHIFGITLE